MPRLRAVTSSLGCRRAMQVISALRLRPYLPRAGLAFSLSLAIPAVAAAKTFTVGPGQEYARIGDVPWSTLRAGDVVQIHYRVEPYREKILISSRGTAHQPIRVVGVRGPAGERPIIEGRESTTGAKMSYRWRDPLQQEALGLIEIGYRIDGPKPGFIEIAHLEIRGARPENKFTASTGRVYPFSRHAACVRMYGAEFVTLQDLQIHDCDNGVFSKSAGGEQFTTRGITLRANEIFGNGRGNGYDRVHNVYLESDGVLIEGNRFGTLVKGSSGSVIKDRSAGTVIRYNWIPNGGRMLDLVEPADGWELLTRRPTFSATFVYGNVFYTDAAESALVTRAIHYGGDQGNGTERRGTLYFYNNTFVAVRDEREGWKLRIFDVTHPDAVIDVRNNIFVSASRTGQGRIELDFSTEHGKFVFGTNWVSPGWKMRFSGEPPFAGTASGLENLISPADNDPGFVDLAKQDFRLRPGASAARAVGELPAAIANNAFEQNFRVTHMLARPAGMQPRQNDPVLGALPIVRPRD
jgi:hypothetical protein